MSCAPGVGEVPKGPNFAFNFAFPFAKTRAVFSACRRRLRAAFSPTPDFLLFVFQVFLGFARLRPIFSGLGVILARSVFVFRCGRMWN